MAGAEGHVPPPSVPPTQARCGYSPLRRVLDYAAVAVVCTGSCLAAFGGIRFSLGPVQVSATSTWKAAVVLAVLMTVRRAVGGSPSMVQTVRTWITGLAVWSRSRSVRCVIPIWAASRFGVLAVGVLATAAVGLPDRAPPGNTGLPGMPTTILSLAHRWDAGWYLHIAADGYSWRPDARHREQNIAFFPAYPLLMRVGGALLGARPDPPLRRPYSIERLRARTLFAGWLMSLTAFLAAMFALHKWMTRISGPRAAAHAVLLLSAFPFAVYFSAAYTEPLFLLGAIAAFNAMETKRSLAAGTWGLFVGLLRPNGFLLAIPLLMIAWRGSTRRVPASLAALMPCAGMLAFSAYIWSLTGRPFAWAEAHAAWGRTLPTWETTVAARAALLGEQGMFGYVLMRPLEVFNGVAVLFAIVMTPAVARRVGAPAAVFVLTNLIPPLIAGGVMSAGRLTSTLFPVFAAMALAIPRTHVGLYVLLFAMLQGLAAVLFFTWRPLV